MMHNISKKLKRKANLIQQKKQKDYRFESCYFAWLNQYEEKELSVQQQRYRTKAIDPECSLLQLPGMHADAETCLCGSFNLWLSRSESVHDMMTFALGVQKINHRCGLVSAWTSNAPLEIRPQLLMERLWQISRILPIDQLTHVMRAFDYKDPCTVQSFHSFWKSLHLACTRNKCTCVVSCASLCPTICGVVEMLTNCISLLWNDTICKLQATHSAKLLSCATTNRNAVGKRILLHWFTTQSPTRVLVPFVQRGPDKYNATISMKEVVLVNNCFDAAAPHPILFGSDLTPCSIQEAEFCITTKQVRNSMFMTDVMRCFDADHYLPLNLFLLYLVAVVRHKLPISLFCNLLVPFLDFNEPELSPNVSIQYLVGSANLFARKLIL